ITLRGNVLPVGGIKEKILAAYRSNIEMVILPKRNKKDLDEIPEYVKKKLNFKYVETIDDVLKIAFPKVEEI
ncbi:hypothetical protein JW979_14895, partial [bacterium]|nr:hypothetical protein [candidate division CSSED10-310 bacterium]